MGYVCRLSAEGFPPDPVYTPIDETSSQYKFELMRDQEKMPWVIQQLERKTGVEPVDHVMVEGLSLGPPRTEMPTLVEFPDFQLLELVPAPEHEEDLVRMTFSYTADEKNPLRGGWVLLDPQHDWVVRKSQVNQIAGGKEFESKIEYDYKEGSSHHPILTKLHLQSGTKENNRLILTREVTTDFDFYEQESVPEKEFMLSAFGLPEPGAEKATRWYLWLGALGLGCLVVGLIAARLRRRLNEA